MSQDPEQSDSTQAAPSRPNIRAMLPSLVVNALLPYVVYQLLTGQGYSTFTSLMVAAILPAIGIAAGWVRTRRVDGIGLISLIFIVIGIVTSLISGDVRFLLLKDSFMTGLFGLALLASLLLPRPLLFYFGRQFVGSGSPEQAAHFDTLWQYQMFRFSMHLMTVVWGCAYVAEALLRVLLLSLLPIPTFLLVSQPMALVVTAGLIVWTLRYSRGVARRGAEAEARAQQPSEGRPADRAA